MALCICSLPPPPQTHTQAFHEPAVEAGITLLNEVGLDPGIDHMLAAQCFDEVHSKGGKVNHCVRVLFACRGDI